MKLESIIAVMPVCLNRWAVGTDKGLPWHCPEDLRDFRERTLNHVCIISLKTLLTIPNRLAGRTVIALTEDISKYTLEGDLEHVIIVNSKVQALEVAEQLRVENADLPKVVYVLGGPKIYELFSDDTTLTHVSLIGKEYAKGTPTVFVNKIHGKERRFSTYNSDEPTRG